MWHNGRMAGESIFCMSAQHSEVQRKTDMANTYISSRECSWGSTPHIDPTAIYFLFPYSAASLGSFFENFRICWKRYKLWSEIVELWACYICIISDFLKLQFADITLKKNIVALHEFVFVISFDFSTSVWEIIILRNLMLRRTFVYICFWEFMCTFFWGFFSFYFLYMYRTDIVFEHRFRYPPVLYSCIAWACFWYYLPCVLFICPLCRRLRSRHFS